METKKSEVKKSLCFPTSKALHIQRSRNTGRICESSDQKAKMKYNVTFHFNEPFGFVCTT